MFEKIKCKSIVLSSIIFILGFAYYASATPINTSATVITSVTVAEVTPLNFGSFTVGVAGGVLTFDAGGTISADPDITHLGGEVGGVASTTGPSASDTVLVFVTGTTLTGPAPPMVIVGNCKGPGAAPLGTDNGSCTFTSAGGVENVQIGGKLTVGASQPPGLYSGTIEVTAGFF